MDKPITIDDVIAERNALILQVNQQNAAMSQAGQNMLYLVLKALDQIQPLGEAVPQKKVRWSLGHRDGNFREIDRDGHQAVMRIVWRMEDDDGPNLELEHQAHAVINALNAANV